ncbi:RNA polymerase sigma factor [Trebonia sp.]|uniref:RNA polymerase sigma factor n=1 Tax=Trebonia sp. TaxID=2767075 RepID=UPI00345C489F
MTAVSPRTDYDDASDVARSLTDPDRFGVVFDRYFSEIHRYVARRLGTDAADDVAAETFLTAFRLRRRFDASRGTVRAWLYGIVTNHVSAYHRQEVRAYRALERAGLDGPADGHADRVAERVDAGAIRRELAGALGELPRGDREVLLLVALGGLSHADVAAALGIPYGTVGSRLNRVRRKLRGLPGVARVIEREERSDG